MNFPSDSFLRRHGTKLIVSLAVGGGFAWLLSHGGLPLVPDRQTFAHFKPWTFFVYLLGLVMIHLLRGMRWRHLLNPIGHVSTRDLLAVSWLGFAAILLLPLRAGEFVRPYLITKKSSIRMWEATGTIAAERVIDGLMLSSILFCALHLSTPLSPLPDHIGSLQVPVSVAPKAANGALILFVCASLVMALFYWWRDFARNLTLRVLGIVSEKFALAVADMLTRIAAGLGFLPSVRHLLPFLLETTAYWTVNALGTWILAWGCGIQGITPIETCVTMGLIGVGIMLPAGPGFFGAYQLSAFLSLGLYFSEETIVGPGAAFVFLLYTGQFAWHMVAALIAFALDRKVANAPLIINEVNEINER